MSDQRAIASTTSELAVIEARDLHCSYGKFEAVRGVDIAVCQGELYALLGSTRHAGQTFGQTNGDGPTRTGRHAAGLDSSLTCTDTDDGG